MASKRYLFLIGFLCMAVSGAYAQKISAYDMKDSSLIPAKNLPQHNEFQNNAYPFPAKPRNQWEFGIKAGLFNVSGDVRSRLFTPGVGIHARKALGYVFSLRGELDLGWARGLNFSPSQSYDRNPAWNAYNSATQRVFYNYKTNITELSLQGVVTLNNIRFHRARTGFNVYAFGGIGGMIYNAKINALNGNTPYNFASALAIASTYENRKDIRDELKDNILDDSYETDAERDATQPELFDKPFRPVFVIGAGVQFKVSNRLNIAIEDKFSAPKTDLLDGQQWQENSVTEPAQSRDFDSYNFFSVGLNINVGAKAVEPLWWINPLDYAYNELNAPQHMKLPKPILDDADGDKVTDQFDEEPNTPAGAPVDVRGVSRDTDGDGVPDFRDKELITPTQCQPVDADGVGKCPEPACCQEIRQRLDTCCAGIRPGNCGIGDLPSITFTGRSVTLSNDARALLASVAQKLRDNPTCRIAVIGYGESSKAAQQLSWDRVNAVINYLVDREGISQDRFIWRSGQPTTTGEDENTVDLRDATGEEGPNTIPAPHPGLRRRN
ncbi:MAG TPA: OmpA family protein [Chitinophagaceae bacterium]|nr:OmpA family protein [Chitinophagaceae bacterium]